MKKFVKILSLLFLAVFLLSTNIMAAAFNTRPVTPDSTRLQDWFDINVSGESYDAINDQSSAALFETTGPGSVNTYLFQGIADYNYSAEDIFGIYSPVTGTLVPIFQMSSTFGDNRPQATVAFLDADSDGIEDDVVVNPLLSSTSAIVGEYLDFGPEIFGYFTTVQYGTDPAYLPPGTPGGGALRGTETHFTEDDRNAENIAWALTFKGHGGNLAVPSALSDIDFDENHWLITFEVFHGQNSFDYDDFIVAVESINAAVPEPATMLLVGSGLIGLAGYGRRKFFKKS